jgi:Tol biopolymer transport system component
LVRVAPPEYVTGSGTLTWSPDGSKVIFVKRLYADDGRQDTRELWRVSAKGGEPEKLGLEMSTLTQPRVHRDSNRIAFASGLNRLDVWAMENFLPPLDDIKRTATAASTAAALTVAANTKPIAPSGPTARQVWASAPPDTGGFMPDGRYLAGPSFDGRYIAFVQGANVAVRETATGEIRRLTSDGDWNKAYPMYPRFTADGSHVVYSWHLHQAGSELRMVPVAGGESRVLYRGKPEAHPYTSTPDGKEILARLEGEPHLQLVAISVADGSLREIKKLDRAGTRLSPLKFSPLGRYVAYARAADSSAPYRNVFLLDMDTREETRLTEHSTDEDVLGWSPDGRRLLFTMQRSSGWDAWSIYIVSGKPRGEPSLIKADIGSVAPLLITSDGSLYYTLRPHGPRLFTAKLDLTRATATVQPLEAERYNTMDHVYVGTWSPDSQHLAYRVLGANRVEEIRIVSLKTGQIRALRPDVSMLHRFFWSPDGSAFVSACLKEPGRAGVYRIDAQSGQVTTLVEPSERRDIVVNRARWSSDGKGVFYGKYLTAIAFRELQTGMDREILPTDNSHFDPNYVEGLQYSVSPDGKQLALCGKDSRSPQHVIKLLEVSSGEVKDAYKLDEGAGSAAVEWTPNGQLLFTARRGPKSGIWHLPLTGDEPRRIEFEGTKPWSAAFLTISPDGKHLAFNAGLSNEGGAQVWALENFLPPLEDPEPSATANGSGGANQ